MWRINMEKEKYNPEKILSKPIHGWSHFAFDEDMRVSYIDDVPIYLLEEIKNSLCNKKNFLYIRFG